MRMSVVITNHNYGRFLGEAIDSALGQTHPDIEVVVVDDGSTDGSPAVIEGYGDRVCAILKPKGGQGSAVNAGWRASSGEGVIFLDADDVLLPGAAEHAARSLADRGIVKSHWPLRVVDEHGRATGAVRPDGVLAEGDLRSLLTSSPDHTTPPQSGSAFARSFLEQVLPMPEAEFRTGADTYLFLLPLAFGRVAATEEPLALYRRHAGSDSQQPFDDRLAHVLRWSEASYEALARHCASLRVPAAPEAWRRNSWIHRLARTRDELDALIPPRTPFVLVDGGDWGMRADARRLPIPFPERNGEYWGPPAADKDAIAELERLRGSGARFLVVASAAFWWLDHYVDWGRYLHRRFRLVAENDRFVAFDLTEPR